MQNNAVKSKWVSVLNSKATSNLYLRLICKFKPQSVIEFLKDSESYDIDIGLASCKEFRLSTAAAYLLERKGDIMGAFSMYMEVCVSVLRTTHEFKIMNDDTME